MFRDKHKEFDMSGSNTPGNVLPLGLNLGIWDRMTSWDEVIEIARLARTRETIAICHKIWARDPSPFEGKIFRTGGVKLAFKPRRWVMKRMCGNCRRLTWKAVRNWPSQRFPIAWPTAWRLPGLSLTVPTALINSWRQGLTA
jgi:hypothetical protein